MHAKGSILGLVGRTYSGYPEANATYNEPWTPGGPGVLKSERAIVTPTTYVHFAQGPKCRLDQYEQRIYIDAGSSGENYHPCGKNYACSQVVAAKRQRSRDAVTARVSRSFDDAMLPRCRLRVTTTQFSAPSSRWACTMSALQSTRVGPTADKRDRHAGSVPTRPHHDPVQQASPCQG